MYRERERRLEKKRALETSLDTIQGDRPDPPEDVIGEKDELYGSPSKEKKKLKKP